MIDQQCLELMLLSKHHSNFDNLFVKPTHQCDIIISVPFLLMILDAHLSLFFLVVLKKCWKLQHENGSLQIVDLSFC